MESKVLIFTVLFLCVYESYGDQCSFTIEEEMLLKQGRLDLKSNFLERAQESNAQEIMNLHQEIETLEQENVHLRETLNLVAKFTPAAPYVKALESGHCYNGVKSNEYTGTLAFTNKGKNCQRWDSQYPHEHKYTDASTYPDESLTDAENYCRDPSNSGFTWCYTTDPDERWEACDITECKTEWNAISCYRFNDTAADYDGHVSTTITGKTCQSWFAQYPHEHDYTDSNLFLGSSIYDNQNYCRDPDGWGLPWCYTTDPDSRWEICATARCLYS